MAKEIKSPVEQSEYGFGLALKLAREKLAAIPDLREQCRKAGAEYREAEQTVSLVYINQPCSIRLPGGDVEAAAGPGALTVRDRILILHYLTQAKGTPLSGRSITYKELPDGITYFPVFYKRAIKPIVTHFGAQPDSLLDIGAGLGGRQSDLGDMAVTFHPVPRVPVTFVLWKGDSEFPPEGNVVLDSSVADYFTNEDVNVQCEILAWKLVRLKLGR